MQAQKGHPLDRQCHSEGSFPKQQKHRGPERWYKIYPRQNNCQDQNKKSQTGCQIQWWQSHHHSIKQARWFVREEGGEAMEEAEGEQKGAAFQVPGQGRHTKIIRLKQQYKELQKR